MEDLVPFFVNEEFTAVSVTPLEYDRLLADGWRHFGPQFFRYNLAIYDDEIRRVLPLRIRLSDFKLSRSQQRVLRRNADVAVNIAPVDITPEIEALFFHHKKRFKQHPPDSIYTFISPDPSAEPCEVLQLSVRSGEKLIAASFFDVGTASLSGTYAVFDSREQSRSLGIFTMLKEIEYAVDSGKEFYYQGYSYSGSSFYDYKKRFHGMETYGWNGVWTPLPRNSAD
jgi:leucyl-tRNA---protein transferase